MHSDIDAIERMEIVRGLRLGEFDVLVGINLLREGLDLPEVITRRESSMRIRKGFLRSDRSLIQTVGRAARPRGRARDLLRRPHHRLDGAVHAGDARAAATTQRLHNEASGIVPRGG
jgi:excinuclease ABC subunit B